MYHRYYHLHTLPFENTSDTRFFFASEQHREALAAIEYTIRMRKGVVLVTGDIGSGKTTVGRVMCRNCGDHASIIEIIPRHNNGIELLRQVLRYAEVPTEASDDYAVLLKRLQAYLTDQFQRRRPVVLFVDEAQNLCDDALEELRLLSNLDTAKQKLIQIVLVGQPELRDRIRQSKYDALRQRIVMAKRLRPLEAQETARYVAHRIRAASIDAKNVKVQFTPAALSEIHLVSGGIPRLINVACDNCLLLGFVRKTNQITPEIVHHVVEDMVPRFDDAPDGVGAEEEAFKLAGSF